MGNDGRSGNDYLKMDREDLKMRIEAFLVEEGVLLTEEDKEFESYAIVYNKKYGLYDEAQYYVKEKQKAIEDAKAYVEAGVESTYAIVSTTALPDDFDFENGYVEGETYLMEDIAFSIAKIDGKIVENFLEIKE